MRIGGRPATSASRTFAHVDALLAGFPGATQSHIARLAGISCSTLVNARRTDRIEFDTEERVLAVTLRHVHLCPPPEMPAHFARAHVQHLLDETGMAPNAIARASGVNYQTVYNVMKPDKPIVKWPVHAALMACTPEDVRSVDHWTERGPSIVRLRALQANCWSPLHLGRRLGMNLSGVINVAPEKPIERSAEARIKALYEEIGDEVGPSPRSATIARRLGFFPPIYYDDDMRLVEVAEQPDTQQEQEVARTRLCILALTAENRQVAEIVRMLGCTEREVSRTRSKYGLRTERALDGAYLAAERWPGALSAIRAATRGLHYRTTIDTLDDGDILLPDGGIDYVGLLASARGSSKVDGPVRAA